MDGPTARDRTWACVEAGTLSGLVLALAANPALEWVRAMGAGGPSNLSQDFAAVSIGTRLTVPTRDGLGRIIRCNPPALIVSMSDCNA
jgi:hypothetical protein